VIFTFYHDGLRSAPFLCVDGVVDEGFNLSHWPGNRTPAHLKADTSTEMALNLAGDAGRVEWLRGVEVVTNNHFDTDGLLSIYAVLRPEEALRHAAPLVQAARAGDFGEFTTPDAFKFDAVVTGFDDDERSPIAAEIRGLPERARYQLLYDRLLGLMPDLIYEAPRYKTLWADPFASLMHSMMRIRDVARIREHEQARLTIIESDEPLDQTARFNLARHHRVLTATRSGDGWIYEMAFQIFSWFETVTPPRGTRIDLTEIAHEFNRAEPPVGGHWTYTGNDSLESRLYREGENGRPVPSRLPLSEVEGRLVSLFNGCP
jgi:hypothetical protein